MNQFDFLTLDVPRPEYDNVAERYARFSKVLESPTIRKQMAAVRFWDSLRQQLETWEAFTHLRFQQDTRNEEYRRERDYCDQLHPKLVELEIAFKRQLLDHPNRPALCEQLGEQAFALWAADILTYDPAIEDDMVREAHLQAKYTELTAAAEIEFQGETHNLSGIVKFDEDPDRSIRHQVAQLHWQWFEDNGERLDSIYSELVDLRSGMATKLGFDSYVDLAYKRMNRIDYDRTDVEKFREAVRTHVVPLAAKLSERQAGALGLDQLMFWDESVYDLQGNPAPQGDHDWMIERAKEMFASMGGGLDDFFDLLNDCHLIDLKMRPGKAGGGFCTSFPTYGVPFIFANFNGTKGDVEVFTHEVGHAFQCFESRNQPISDYHWPTMESCEIHSMGLEYLTWPEMERFFGDQADRFRTIHLTQAIMFIPYGVAIDHFQHLVHDRPDASPDERHAMWREMERTYLPWRDYGDLARATAGGIWQAKQHIYVNPFYYIDYTLALTCALQFWTRSRQDYQAAMNDYVTLCRRGGEAPFQDLLKGAGLDSPFVGNTLESVMGEASEWLGL